MYGLPKDFDGKRLVGHELVQVCFGLYQIQLHFHERLSIFVESAFLYSDSPTSETTKIALPDLPQTQAKLLQLLQHTIVNAYGDKKGTLTLAFDNGHVLQCLERPDYEAYQIQQGDELIIV